MLRCPRKQENDNEKNSAITLPASHERLQICKTRVYTLACSMMLCSRVSLATVCVWLISEYVHVSVPVTTIIE